MQYRTQTTVTIGIGLLVLVLLAVITWVVFENNQPPSAADSLFESAINTTFVDAKGDEVAMDQYDNQVRVINSWATWSPFSVQELQDLNTIAREYQDRAVVVLAVNRDEPQVRIDAFLNSLPEPLSHVQFVVDTEDGLYDSFSGYAMPETLFYDAQGNLIHHQRGVASIEVMRTYTEAALAASQ